MSDQERIQGTWQPTAGERGGKPFSEDVMKNAQLVFEGDKMTTKVKDRSTSYKIKLLPEQSPKAADLDGSQDKRKPRGSAGSRCR